MDSYLRHLPSPLAIPFRDYRAEKHPVLRLHRLCDAVEILTRFLTIAALGEIRRAIGAGPLPDRLLRALQPNIERPTLGRWRDMLLALVSELAPQKELVLPEMCDFARSALLPSLAATVDVDEGGRKERREARPGESILVVRNDLAHGLAMSAAAAQTTLDRWEPWLDDILAKLTFLHRFDVCVIAGAVAMRLIGPSIERGTAVPIGELADTQLEQLHGHVVMLERGPVRPIRLLDLWPLCGYGRTDLQENERPIGAESPMMYFRYEYDRLLYAALGVDLARAELSDQSVVQQFRDLFKLASRIAPSAPKVSDFVQEVRRDSDMLVGRRDDLKRAKQAIRDAVHDVVWISGTAGIGKSFLMARIASDLGNARQTCCVVWRFKIGDVARCNRYAFFRHAVERLLVHIDRPDITPEPDPRELFRQLHTILDYISQLPPTSRPRLLFFVDGLDEIARLDPDFLRLPFEFARPGMIWICAGQPTELVMQVFDPARCTIVFPGGLPVMSDADIRAMLVDDTGSLKYRLLQRDAESIDACSGEVTIANPAVRAVCDRAQGLPLLVHFVVEDILSGHYNFEKLELQLPPRGLVAYYDDLLRRMPIGELQAVLTPLVTALVWAEAPVDEATLALVLRRRKVMPADEAQSQSLLRRALNAVRMMIRPTPATGGTGETPLSAWEPYHNDLRQHVRTDPSGIIGSQNTLAREAYCELTVDWRSIPPGHPALAYVLRHGPQHLVASQDWELLAALVRDSAFMQQTAARLGVVVALENSRTIATALAGAGDRYWDDLLRSADDYCRFSEAIRNSPSVLEAMIRHGEVKDARNIIEKQPDEFLRGVLMLAAAPLVEEAGHPKVAAEFEEQGTSIIASKVERGVDMGEWYSPETKELVGLLMSYKPHSTDLRPIDVRGVGRVLESDATRSGTLHRTRLPLLWQALAHAASVRTRFYTQKSIWIAVGLMADVLFYQVVTGRMSSAGFPDWLAIPFGLLFAWMFTGLALFAGVDRILGRLSNRFATRLRAVAVAVERLPEADRQRHYARLLRFFHRTRSAKMPPLCESLFGYWTARQFEGLRDRPEDLAGLVIDASRMWESTIDTLICCMASLNAAQVRQVYWTVLDRSFPSADYGRVLYMVVHSVAATGDVDLLVHCLERFRRLTDVATKEESAAAKPKLLFCLSRIDMARAVLASMHRPLVPTVGWLRERLVRLLFDFPMMDGARLVIRSPFEFFLAFALITPYGLFLGTGIVIAFFFFIVPIMALVLLAGAPHDPYGLIRRCRGQLPTAIRQTLAARLPGADFSWDFWRLGARFNSGWVLAPAAQRYMRQSAIAQNILRNERADVAASHRVMQRVVSWFIREGLYGRPAEIVIKVMDDRRLLAAAHVGGSVSTTANRVTPGFDEDVGQLTRVLPLRSSILGGLIGILLSAVITVCWLAVCGLLFPNDIKTWLWPRAAVAVASGCLFLVIAKYLYSALQVEHLVPQLIEVGSRQWESLSRLVRRSPGRILQAERVSVPAVAVWYQIFMGIVSIVLLYRFASSARDDALALGIAYPIERSDGPFLFGVAAIAILTTKALVPSLMARWRGSRLLYPTRAQLWRERLAGLLELAIGATILAVIAHWEIAGGATREAVSAHYSKQSIESFGNADFATAMRQAADAIRFDAGNAEAYGLRCALLGRSREHDLAVADCEDALRLGRTAATRVSAQLYGYAKTKYDKHDYEMAMAEVNGAIAIDPGNVDALTLRCQITSVTRQWEHAIADCGDVMRVDPENALAVRSRAIAYEMLRNYEHAIADFTELIRLQPAESSAWNGRCWLRAIVGQLTGALEDCNEALRAESDNALALDSRGFVHLKMGGLDAAIADYDAALRIKPRLAESLFGRGVARRRKGDEGGDADIAAAKALVADIVDRFAEYGVK